MTSVIKFPQQKAWIPANLNLLMLHHLKFQIPTAWGLTSSDIVIEHLTLCLEDYINFHRISRRFLVKPKNLNPCSRNRRPS